MRLQYKICIEMHGGNFQIFTNENKNKLGVAIYITTPVTL